MAPVLFVNAASSRPSMALGLVSVVALLATLLAAGYSLARRLLPAAAPFSPSPTISATTVPAPAASLWSAAGVFATALLVLPAILLGHFGALDPGWYLGLEALAALFVTGALRRDTEGSTAQGARRHRANGGDGAVGLTDASRPASRWRDAVRWRNALLTAAFAIALTALLVALYTDHDKPVRKLDDPSYHLISVATWIQHQDLRMPHFQYGDPATAYYPIAGEVIDWAAMAPLRDSDFLARWAQLPYLVGLLLAVAAVCRRLGVTPATATAAAALLLSVRRLFPELSLSAANDVMEAYFVVAAVDALLAWGQSAGQPADETGSQTGAHPVGRTRAVLGCAIYLGCAVGLMLGTKYLGVLLAPPILLATLLLPWLASAWPRRRLGLGRHAAALGLAGTVAAVVGGYAYLRNAVSVGNPIFPVPLHLGPLSLPGWEQATLAFRSTLPEFAIDPLGFLFTRVVFTGLPYYLTLLPAALLAPLACTARRRGRAWPLELWVLALPAVFYALFVFRVYDHREVRYLFAALGLAAVAYAWLVSRLPPPWQTPVVATTAFLTWAGVIANHPALLKRHLWPTLAAVAVVTAIAFALGWTGGSHGKRSGASAGGLARAWAETRRGLNARPVLLTAVPLAALLLAALALSPLAATYAASRHDADPVLRALADAQPKGAEIQVLGGNRWYDLFGAHLQNRVVPAAACPPDIYYHWGDPDFRDPSAPPSGRCRQRLHGGDWLVVYPNDGGARDRDWMHQHPEYFQRVAGTAERELWRFRNSPPGSR